VRRREWRRSYSANDDEVADQKARSASAMFAPPICRRADETLTEQSQALTQVFVGSDEDGGSAANIAASGAIKVAPAEIAAADGDRPG
jgi:hypothetical protein